MSNTVNRRGFIAGAIGGSALIPGITREVVAESGTRVAAKGHGVTHEDGNAIPKEANPTIPDRILKIRAMKGKLPSWKEARMRARAKDIRALDPDIACLRSFSLTARYALQAERNFQREKQAFFEMADTWVTYDEANAWMEWL